MRPIMFSLALLSVFTGCYAEVRPAPPPRVVVEEDPPVETHEVVEVEAQPPAPQVEVVTVAPSPTHVWVGGYWSWRGGRWVWFGGRWIRPAHPGYHWRAGVWVRGGGGRWHLTAGAWVR